MHPADPTNHQSNPIIAPINSYKYRWKSYKSLHRIEHQVVDTKVSPLLMNNISQEYHKLLLNQNQLISIHHSKHSELNSSKKSSNRSILPLLTINSVVSNLDAVHYVHDNNLNLVIIARKMIGLLKDQYLHYTNQNISSNLDHNIQKSDLMFFPYE